MTPACAEPANAQTASAAIDALPRRPTAFISFLPGDRSRHTTAAASARGCPRAGSPACLRILCSRTLRVRAGAEQVPIWAPGMRDERSSGRVAAGRCGALRGGRHDLRGRDDLPDVALRVLRAVEQQADDVARQA